MFNPKSKIVKKDHSKPTDLELEVGKVLKQSEMSNPELKDYLNQIFITKAEFQEFTQADGTKCKTLVVRIPYRSLVPFQKTAREVVEQLEKKFEWPAIVVAVRNIQSKNAITHVSQKRPRSRTLTAVHQATLEDIVYPATITGKHTRVFADGKKQVKILIDPLDKEFVEDKAEAMAAVYQKLTTHKIQIGFSKPTAFQLKKIAEKK